MNIKCWQKVGFVFTIIVGTLLHFTYEWSGANPIVGMFSAVNESVWEHLKLLFTPMLLFAIFEFFVYGKNIKNFIPVKALSILIGMLTIIVSYYTYTGIVGEHYLWADIAIFILGVLIAYCFSCRFLNTDFLSTNTAIQLGWVVLILMIVCFAYFTFNPPHIGLFQDPITGEYGI